MIDIWVCGTCHSINRQRNARCYKCSAKQDMSASGPLADLRAERALVQRAAKPYRSSLIFAIIASAFILIVAVLGVLVLIESLAGIRFIREQLPAIIAGTLDEGELRRVLAGAVVPIIIRSLCAAMALLAFATWLSRVFANIPALGGGSPSVSSTRAFFTPFIPVYNLVKVPPLIQEALYKVDPRAGGFFMVAAAWIGLVGSAIVTFVIGSWFNLRVLSIAQNAQTLGQAIEEFGAAYDLLVIVEIITTLMVAAGAIILVVVMLRIESRARARDHEIRRAAKAGVGREVATVPDSQGRSLGASGVPSTSAASATQFVAASPAVPAPARVGTTVSAMSLGASPVGSLLADAEPAAATPATGPAVGPRLRVRVTGERIFVSIDGDVEDPSSLDELRQAAPALVGAGGSAIVGVEVEEDVVGAALAGEIVTVLRAAGVPTTLA